MHSSGGCRFDFFEGERTISQTALRLDIPPGTEEMGSRRFLISKSCKVMRYQIDLSVKYLDPNGREFNQSFTVPVLVSMDDLRKRYFEVTLQFDSWCPRICDSRPTLSPWNSSFTFTVRGAGESVKPGVKRSGTPGTIERTNKPAKRAAAESWRCRPLRGL